MTLSDQDKAQAIPVDATVVGGETLPPEPPLPPGHAEATNEAGWVHRMRATTGGPEKVAMLQRMVFAHTLPPYEDDLWKRCIALLNRSRNPADAVRNLRAALKAGPDRQGMGPVAYALQQLMGTEKES